MERINNKRIEWVDVAKGIGIFLVVLGHTSSQLRNLIYGFHMPLFFFLSGFVLQREKYTFKGFAKSRFNSLIIPYIFFYLLTYLYWLFVERSMRSFDIDWWQPLLGLFYGSQWHDLMIHNGILWFLPCLFLTEIIVYVLGEAKTILLQLLIVVILAVVGVLFKENLPWGLNIAMVATQFFFVAWKSKSSFNSDSIPIMRGMIYAVVIFALYVVGKIMLRNEVNMGECIYSNITLFELFSYLGVAGTIIVSLIIGKPIKELLIWMGRNSLVIFAIHQPVSRIVRFMIERFVSGVDIQNNIIMSIVVSVFVILLLWPLVILYNNYCNPMLKKLYIR